MKMGDVVDSRYAIEALAGEGGMASVYRARDAVSGATVALKTLHDVDRSSVAEPRFAREIRILAELNHPGIVRYLAHGLAGAHTPYLVMEWLDGEDLDARLKRVGRLSVADSVTLVTRAGEALATAHARGVLHRDLKPHNLFLVGGDVERVKVLDFGVARRGGEGSSLTGTDGFVGTPAYAAPEHIRGARDLDARADIFSLGCVLFQCLTGRPPFEGDHVMAVFAKILFDEARALSDLRPDAPPWLSDLVARMLSRDPSRRPQSTGALLRALSDKWPAGAKAEPAAPPAPEALTSGEQKLISVLLATPEGADLSTGATIEPNSMVKLSETVNRITSALEAHVERLADGTVLAALTGAGAVTDQAAQAARCALAIRAALPDADVVLATGRGVINRKLPVSQVIDRAVAMLKARQGAFAEQEARARGERGRQGALEAQGGPERRPIYVDDKTATLLASRFLIGGKPGAHELQRERESDDGARLLLGRPTPYVGRDREMALLEGLWDACTTEPRAEVVLVTGAAGAGKSRLRVELLRRLQQRSREEGGAPLAVWTAECDPLRTGSPFGALRQMLRRAAGMMEGEPLEAQRDKLRRFAAEHLAPTEVLRAAEILGEITGAPFPDEQSEALRGARAEPALMNEKVRRCFQELVVAASAERPLLLVVEDLHWGDAASAQTIAMMIHRLESPVMALFLARPEARDLFMKLFTDIGGHEVRLGELSKKASRRLALDVLGDAVPSERIDHIVEQASGNAFYLEELIRALAEGGGEGERGALPVTVLGMVEARLMALEGPARRIIRAGSVFGEVFWEGGVAALLHGSESEKRTLDWLFELAMRELIQPNVASRLPGEREYAFRHALVREAAYATLTEEDRALGHRLAAEWLSRAMGMQSGASSEHFGLIGEHYLRGEAWLLAADHLERAGDMASKLFANAEACEHYRRAMECLSRLSETDETRRRRLRLLLRSNDLAFMAETPARGLSRLLEAERLAKEIQGEDMRLTLARVHGMLGRIYLVMGDLPSAGESLRCSIDEATALGAEDAAAAMGAMLTVVRGAQGRWREASDHSLASSGPLERAGDWTSWFIAVGSRAMGLSVRGRYSEAKREVDRLFARLSELKSPTTLVTLTQNYVLYMHFAAGNHAEALKAAEASVEAAARSGDGMLGWVGHWIGAYSRAHLGDHEGAELEASKARESLESFGGRLFIHHWSLAADAVRLLLAGRREDAIRAAEEAIALTQTIEDSYGQGIALRVLGQARAAEGLPQWDVAEAHFNESERLLMEIEAVIELARTWEARGLARRARGDAEGARAYFKRALDKLEESGLPEDAARVRTLLEAVSSLEEPPPAR